MRYVLLLTSLLTVFFTNGLLASDTEERYFDGLKKILSAEEYTNYKKIADDCFRDKVKNGAGRSYYEYFLHVCGDKIPILSLEENETIVLAFLFKKNQAMTDKRVAMVFYCSEDYELGTYAGISLGFEPKIGSQIISNDNIASRIGNLPTKYYDAHTYADGTGVMVEPFQVRGFFNYIRRAPASSEFLLSLNRLPVSIKTDAYAVKLGVEILMNHCDFED